MTEEEIKHNAWKNAVEHYGTSETKESVAYERGFIESANLILSQLTEKDKQLAETKEMLKKVLISYAHDERFTFEKVLKRAEQFLGEEKMTEEQIKQKAEKYCIYNYPTTHTVNWNKIDKRYTHKEKK